MERAELKKIIDEALNTDSVIDGTTDAHRVNVYTQVWYINFSQIDEIRSRGVELTRVSVEGYHLTLTARI